MMGMNKGAALHNVVLTVTACVEQRPSLFDAFGYVDALNDVHSLRFIYALVDAFGIDGARGHRRVDAPGYKKPNVGTGNETTARNGKKSQQPILLDDAPSSHPKTRGRQHATHSKTLPGTHPS